MSSSVWVSPVLIGMGGTSLFSVAFRGGPSFLPNVLHSLSLAKEILEDFSFIFETLFPFWGRISILRFYLFIERGKGREEERERNINVWLLLSRAPTEDLARNPGLCPDWESNLRPLALWNNARPTEPHRSGGISVLKMFH